MDRSSQGRNTALIVAAVIAVVCVCLCLALVVIGGWWLRNASTQMMGPVMTAVERTIMAPTPGGRAPTQPPDLVRTPVPTPLPGASETLQTLEDEVIPESDLRELAMRLKGVPNIPEVVSSTSPEHEVGQELDFYITNNDTTETSQTTARLVYKTDNVYFFSETDVPVDEDAVRELVDDFQKNIYPTDREFFGEEWNPGVDGDPHLYILYARGLGDSVAGYYSSGDEYSRLAHDYSNEKEMFYISADNTSPGDPSLPGVLAHEFQHMIHWYHDRNEETWMNEGASELAAFLNGYGQDSFDYTFISEPDLQLNTWTEGGPDDYTPPHYGAGFLFMTYFLDRFGNEATQALVADPNNGLRAVDDVLAEFQIKDPATNAPITAVDVFADWVIANYLGDANVADGRYEYNNYTNAPTVSFPADSYSDCPASETSTVFQYAADYYEINCPGQVTISFTGSQQVRVVPTDPHSGRYAFWSHRNDESDTRLIGEFDLSGLSSATLTYWAWWEIEKDWDFAYLVVSIDGGQTWKIVETPSCSSANPTGNNLGCGYTGGSNGGDNGEWIQERVDLSEFAGEKILIGFEYVTDAAVNRAGLMVDDIAIEELGYSTDFEAGEGGWNGDGFVRIDNLLPQQFVVQVITQGDETTVQRVPLDADNTGSLTLTLAPGSSAVLVISGVTPFTTQPASYEFEVK